MTYEQIADKFYTEHQEVVKDMFLKYLKEQEKNRFLSQLLISKTRAYQFKRRVTKLLKTHTVEEVAEKFNVSESIIDVFREKQKPHKLETIVYRSKCYYIKTEEGWVNYKKYMYEKYYNIKLSKQDRVISIDGNHKNVRKENLKLCKRKR